MATCYNSEKDKAAKGKDGLTFHLICQRYIGNIIRPLYDEKPLSFRSGNSEKKTTNKHENGYFQLTGISEKTLNWLFPAN